MKTFIGITLFFILLVLCWPLALVMIVLLPILWLLLLPFKIVGLSIDLIFKLLTNIVLLPFRLLGIK